MALALCRWATVAASAAVVLMTDPGGFRAATCRRAGRASTAAIGRVRPGGAAARRRARAVRSVRHTGSTAARRAAARRHLAPVVLMSPRRTADGQHAVAHELRDEAVIARGDAGMAVLVEPRRDRRRPLEIAEHHRQLPPLGLRLRRRRAPTLLGDGTQYPAAVAEHDTELLQIAIAELAHHIE